MVVAATYDPDLVFVDAFPPPDIGTEQWTIGTLPAGSAERIYLTLAPGSIPQGSAPQVRMVVYDDSGHSSAAVETTVFTKQRAPYVLTITGVPKPQPRHRLDGVLRDSRAQHHRRHRIQRARH